MRNIVGQPVSGDDYFVREAITNLIYRRLDAGSNLFMAAPRRVGKTSIMFHLRDNPRGIYSFLYVPTESIDNSELYFKRLFEALLNSEAVTRKIKVSQKSRSIFEKITDRVKKIGAFSVEVELQSGAKEKYEDIFRDLMKKLDNGDIHIVMMIDEFPSTIENIHQKEGMSEAVRFLKINRTIRQESAGGIQFIYTGSIGLPAIVNRLNLPESINDLNPVEIPPLSLEEGKAFTEKLLTTTKVPYEPEAIDHLLDKIMWLMPFFIQLSVQEIVDLYDQNNTPISNNTIDAAFENICNRRNNIHFDSYYNRLEDAFSKSDYILALKVLNLVANNNQVAKDDLMNEGFVAKEEQQQLKAILESLEYDGYIYLRDDKYAFNSPILQIWWKKYIQS